MPKFSCISPTYNQFKYLDMLKSYWDAQTFKDFEWILAVDGEGEDGTLEWAKANGIKASHHPKKAFELSRSFNEGVALSTGEYVVLVTGDSYPKPDFLEQLNKVVSQDRLVSGIRINVDSEGNFESYDWRLNNTTLDESKDEKAIITQKPWELMSGNPSCFHRNLFNELKGYYEGYFGGREDWDFAMRAHYLGIKMFWAPKAVVYQMDNHVWFDSQDVIALFDKREEEARNGSKKLQGL